MAAFFCFINLSAQISPGDLTKAHSKYEGMSNCTKCHELGKAVSNNKCLTCHKEIAALISKERGFHVSPEARSKDCFSCHSEHHGRNFQIVRFDEKSFDHNKTGFKLIGKHNQAECAKCHKADFITDKELKSRKGTYLGLEQTCLSCHEDFHKGKLGSECSSCHGNDSFKPAVNFDHNRTKFKLTGSHQKVECEKCHRIEETKEGKFQRFTGLNFNSCESCHNDIHNGAFGKSCTDCHSTESFKKILNIDKFDHGKTKFPLLGKHTNLDCKKCHSGGIASKPEFEKCANCHEDYHKGQFSTINLIRDCSECHVVENFTPSLFSITEHNNSQFKLTGGHLATPCESCHLLEGIWNFRVQSDNCARCHKNVHGDQISEAYLGKNRCENCHDTDLWSSVTFDHNKTKFSLFGRHNQIQCSSCHIKETFSGKKLHLFKNLSSECESCHSDIHKSQFAIDGKTDCLKCHGFNDWKPEKFDHSKTKFSLAGAHEKVPCSECHKIVEVSGEKYRQFRREDIRCIVCHS